MTYIQTIILGIVEGLTEFLPISSTGHLIITQKLLGITSTEFTKSFDILIQLSAILAVAILYWKKILSSKKLWFQITLAFIPTGVLGLTLYRYIKGFLLSNVLVTIIALFIGGILLLVVDRLFSSQKQIKSITNLRNKDLVTIGLFQSLSMIPGVSRSAASIVGGLFSGMTRVEAVEFSFLLAIPTMVVASGYDLLKTGFSFSSQEITILFIGSFFSFISSIIAVKSFTAFVAKHNFTVFAIYRIVFAMIMFVLLRV